MIFIRDRGVLLKDENDVDLKTSMGLRFLMEEIRTVIYTSHYNSPIGRILLASRNENLIGLWIENQKYYFDCVKEKTKKQDRNSVLLQTKQWLDRYFAGEKPSVTELNIAPIGSDFRKVVWQILCEIPYGETTTYGEISSKVAVKLGKKRMSAQAVGGAVGHNPISIIIPCHRVVGSNGSLTGYAGGINKKIELLVLEGAWREEFFVPQKSAAP